MGFQFCSIPELSPQGLLVSSPGAVCVTLRESVFWSPGWSLPTSASGTAHQPISTGISDPCLLEVGGQLKHDKDNQCMLGQSEG
ncbi:hypothetical protein PBY51_007571 [Eleginops maclovinus]|uniref:Uncharacterized protein n=1 Tax=Eleginops maclovinus TaxID=56733 RepID=A0AAN8AAY6_ELEMC|nr:hypothetical protein PBY51_007571 [Eleginops maclovinus]